MNIDTKNLHNLPQDFLFYLGLKSRDLIHLYGGLRSFLLDVCPDANELLYHTHALTSLYTVTDKMSDGFCMIPVYTGHLNLGFNKGTLLKDPHGILVGTGKLIRHIPVTHIRDYNNARIRALVKDAMRLALEDADPNQLKAGLIISKIKRPGA